MNVCRKFLLVCALLLATFLLVPTEIISQKKHVHKGVLHKFLEDTFSTNALYYYEQRPMVEAAAKRFQLHWYFAQLRPFVDASLEQTSLQLTTLRMSMFAQNLKIGRDDFRLEKDKRSMNHFFLDNGIPISPILGEYDDNETVIDALRSGKVLDKVTRWPIYLKVFHMHGDAAGSRGSTIPISEDKLRNDMGDIANWVNSNFVTKSDDSTRPWRSAGNEITGTVQPGFMIQQPAFDDVSEVRVWVVFGRAVMAAIPGCSVIRGQGVDDAEVHAGWGFGSLVNSHRFLGDKTCESRWPYAEGHFPCVWPLAELVARRMMIDMVRVDIFVGRGFPSDCKVNEISLSSGYPLGAYERFVGKLWAEPHLKEWYTVVQNATSPPIYKQVNAGGPAVEVVPAPSGGFPWWSLLLISLTLNAYVLWTYCQGRRWPFPGIEAAKAR